MDSSIDASCFVQIEPRSTSERFGRFVLLWYVPLVAAFQAFAILAARLGELHLGTEVAALGTLLGHWFVPDDEVAVLVRARIERGAALARAPLHELTAVLRAEDPRWHRSRSSAF